jgi:hypothetical protein
MPIIVEIYRLGIIVSKNEKILGKWGWGEITIKGLDVFLDYSSVLLEPKKLFYVYKLI